MAIALEYIRTEDGQFKCPHCGVQKRIQSTMHYHMRKCSEPNENECTICNTTFYSKQSLAIHNQIRHGGAAPVQPQAQTQQQQPAKIALHSCPIPGCTVKPATKGNRRTHCMRKHFADITDKYMSRLEHGDYHCSLCSADFSNSTHYYYHAADCLKANASDDLLDLPDDRFSAFVAVTE
jgi:hypothetical protein